MHNISSRTGARGSLSTYREQDSEDDGLLRSITQETTRSRWGSESTGLGTGSRRGSVLDGVDKDIRLGSIKRPEEIHSMDDLQRVRDRRSRGEEYLRSALSAIGTIATDVTRRLDYTYYGLLEKIAALNVTVASFQELSDTVSKLFDDFQRETTGLEQDLRKQIGDLHEFQPQVQRIEALEKRMRDSKTRAKVLGNRLEAMRNEVERWDKREMEWQMRTNQRLRIFRGIVTAAILAVLLAIVFQHWPSDETTPGFRAVPKALKPPNIPSHVPLPKKAVARSKNSKGEYTMTAEPSILMDNGSTIQPDTPTSSGTEAAPRPPDYDPLRILDEL
ncbi:uncharacterized protein DSM5745_09701 [Aspergillus mulundensis]|uniref:Uncharacterized protein n=1 Tax=Aspergillus mulundensis TaxID=1810919 RepID=A0A3D8QRM2_9EURO|nr:Uncharacterized protein DSM5745_09701 [Aspergillus mulundensis]RDW64290.1 Uncharacterized protein DSM5745_09701 [Aspergillus mulundensis]